MKKNRNRTSAEGYFFQILIINGEVPKHSTEKSFYIENIGRGGFRFLSDVKYNLEDRVQVLLSFPDGHTQQVLGRICYVDETDVSTEDESKANMVAYGFSVIEGFYSLTASAA